MRRLTLTQDIDTDVDGHWKLFFDDAFDRAQAMEGLSFQSYEVLEHRETDDEIIRRVRAVPKLDVPAVVAKALGPRFGYTEEGSFDKKTKVFRSRLIPNILTERLGSDAVVRVEPAGDRARRVCELSIECKVFGIGGLIESALEKDLKTGWAKSATFMNDWIRRHRAP